MTLNWFGEDSHRARLAVVDLSAGAGHLVGPLDALCVLVGGYVYTWICGRFVPGAGGLVTPLCTCSCVVCGLVAAYV